MTTVKAVDPNQTVPASVEAAPNVAPALSEEAKKQLDYAQKIINTLQRKVNEANGVIVQLETQVEILTEELAVFKQQLGVK